MDLKASESKTAVFALALIAIGACSFVGWKYLTTAFSEPMAPAIVQKKAMVALADAIQISDPDEVICVEVNKKFFAIPKKYLISPHILNFDFEDKPIAVTYCSLADCTRIFTDSDSSNLNLRLVDFDYSARNMRLEVAGRIYQQTSEEIPLAEVEFEILDFRGLKQIHPQALIYGYARQ